MSRSLPHVATDWPGHFPRVAESIQALVEAGADVNARFRGPHEETPLHWAASSDDVAALDALLDAGADIETPGAVLGGGPPLADARGFKQWNVASRLVERGGPHLARRPRHPRAARGNRRPLRHHDTRSGGDHVGVLGRMPRRTATLRGIPVRSRRRRELAPPLEKPHPARRSRP
ncbi:ankyrin repeat domain-containing protein [Allokutzneria sp. A3M-2-11 16]|uniref:ankyrin repeat domain-containing protein n=1 Tax=Allokutzneria sp. A3M-2-11 16 TaxID=2962043 RepID=UPI0035A99450